MRKGYTIIELLVSMTIFLVVMTLVVSAFISISKLKSLTGTMRDSQQKLRIANEMIMRYAKDATEVSVTGENTLITKYQKGGNTFCARFRVDNHRLLYSEFQSNSIASCTFGAESNLLEGVVLVDTIVGDPNTSYFKKIGEIPPVLQFGLSGTINGASSSLFNRDSFSLTNAVTLEGVY